MSEKMRRASTIIDHCCNTPKFEFNNVTRSCSQKCQLETFNRVSEKICFHTCVDDSLRVKEKYDFDYIADLILEGTEKVESWRKVVVDALNHCEITKSIYTILILLY